MKKIKFLIPLLALLSISISFSQPKMVVHLTGGVNLPAADFGGSPGLIFVQEHYYMNSGPNFGGDVKYFINKNRTLGLFISGVYNFFHTDDLKDGTDEFGNPITVKSKLNVLSLSLGAEYRFLTTCKYKPFIGAELSGYFYNGKETYSRTFPEFSIKATRFGFALGTGVDWALSKSFGLVLGAKYNFANIIGKKDSSESKNANQIGLIDKEYTRWDLTFPSRQIQYLQFYAGVSFFFMQKKEK